MKLTHEELKPIEILDSVICNCCGKPIEKVKISINEPTATHIVEHVNIKKHFGYLSQRFVDGEKHDFDVCESCYAKWLKTFKHMP